MSFLVIMSCGVCTVMAEVQESTPALDGSERPPSEGAVDRRALAKSHFERGLLLARNDQLLDAALAEFLASRELFPTRSATRNAALLLRKLERAAEALELYTKLLDEFSESLPSDERSAAEADVAELRKLVGELDLQTDPPDCTVVIDGRQRGVAFPPSIIRLDVGSHTVRLSKEGFESIEVPVSLAGGQRRLLRTRLKPLRASGTLVVREATGARLEVVLDSALAGRAPWTGRVAPGLHSVLLRGEGELGTAPASAHVRADATTTLTLRAVPLRAGLLVEPRPVNAAVYIDGVSVGNGVWQARLPAGRHLIEVTAPGYRPFRRELELRAGEREVMRADLERSVSDTMGGGDTYRPSPYVDLHAGALLASSVAGDEDTCRCQRSLARGLFGGGRVGYALREWLGLEIGGGYLFVKESRTRQLTATGERASWVSPDYSDTTSLQGPFAAASASIRVQGTIPVTARVGAGLVALLSHTTNQGTFSSAAPSGVQSRPVAIDETPVRLLTPFLSTELLVGFRVSKRISVDVGLALLLLVPPRAARAGANSFSNAQTRVTVLEAGAQTETLKLPEELVARPFLALAPTLGVRFGF